jgi:S-adenosylmethionine uptake transporter
MVLGAFLFATMGVCIKYASAHFHSLEIVAYRGAVGVVFLWVVTRIRGVSLKTQVPAMHAWRSVVGVCSLITWFFAISVLPLATAMTLNYMSSVWLGAFLLGGLLLLQKDPVVLRRQGPLFLAILAGFVGVALLLRPNLQAEQVVGTLAGLLSGVTAALAYLQVSALAQVGEPESRTVFYFSLGAALVGTFGTLIIGGSYLFRWEAVWLLPIGLLAVLGQLCMTRAYSSGATLVVANLQYTGIVFAAIYSVVVFGDQLPWLGWLGIGLIILSGVVATLLRAKAAPNSPVEDHS